MDQLRALAIIAVVLIHVSLVYLASSRIDIHSFDWFVSNVFYSMCRFCVPIFLMISGILLLNKDYDFIEFTKKRYTRVILPFLFWGIIYIIFSLIILNKSSSIHSFFSGLGFIEGILGGTTTVFWYVWLILLVYLFIPLMNQWIKKSSTKEIEYFLLIWLVIYALGLLSIPSLELRFFSLYLGFPILGYYLANKKSKILENNTLGPFLFILSVLIAVFVTTYQSFAVNETIRSICSYQNINTVMQAVGVFLIVKNLNENESFYLKKASNFLKEGIVGRLTISLSKYSYGIFLTHMIFVNLFIKIGLLNIDRSAIKWIPFITIICLILTWGMLFVLGKISQLKKFTGAH